MLFDNKYLQYLDIYFILGNSVGFSNSNSSKILCFVCFATVAVKAVKGKSSTIDLIWFIWEYHERNANRFLLLPDVPIV